MGRQNFRINLWWATMRSNVENHCSILSSVPFSVFKLSSRFSLSLSVRSGICLGCVCVCVCVSIFLSLSLSLFLSVFVSVVFLVSVYAYVSKDLKANLNAQVQIGPFYPQTRLQTKDVKFFLKDECYQHCCCCRGRYRSFCGRCRCWRRSRT